jgi:hypothetical protein
MVAVGLRVAILPGGQRHYPAMHLHPARVGLRDQIGKRVVARGEVGGDWLGGIAEITIGAPPYLYDQRIRPGALGIRQQALGLGGRFDAFVKGIHPKSAQLRWRRRVRRSSGKDQERGENDEGEYATGHSETPC